MIALTKKQFTLMNLMFSILFSLLYMGITTMNYYIPITLNKFIYMPNLINDMAFLGLATLVFNFESTISTFLFVGLMFYLISAIFYGLFILIRGEREVETINVRS